MNKKVEPLFRVSYIVQGAQYLDTALKSANGIAVYPPLVEPYQDVPTPTVVKRGKAKSAKERVQLKDLIYDLLVKGSVKPIELSKIAKENKFSRGNISKAARSAGGIFNPNTKTWRLK